MMKRKSITPPPQHSIETSQKSFKFPQKRSISPNSVSSYKGKKNKQMGRSIQTATVAPSTRTSIMSSKNLQQQTYRDKLREKGFSSKNSIGSCKDVPSQSPHQPPYFGNNESFDKTASPPSMSATNQFESQFLISNQKEFTLPAQQNGDPFDLDTLNTKRQIHSTSKKQGKITPTSQMVLQQMSKITQIQRKNQENQRMRQVSPQQGTSISMAELNKKFFYNPTQTPRKMADYAARRNNGNNLSPIDSQSRNRNTFQLNKRNNTRNVDGLSASINEAGKMLSKSQINSKNNFFSDIGSSQSSVSNLKNMKNDFSPNNIPDRRTSPDSKGFKIAPRSQTPKERVRDKSQEQSYNLPRQILNNNYQKQQTSPSPIKKTSDDKIKDLEEKNRALQNILISFQKKNNFLEEELQKMHDRSKIEKQKTMKQIEMVGQNYRKYADYYKKYLQEKNQFERAQRDIITLHLRVQNDNKFLQEICQSGFCTVESLHGIQHHLRSLKHPSQITEQNPSSQGVAIDQTIAQICQKLIQKLAQVEKTPLGISFGQRAALLASQQNKFKQNKVSFNNPTVSFGVKDSSQLRRHQDDGDDVEDQKFQNISEQDFYKRNIPGYVKKNSPEKRGNQNGHQKKGFEYNDYIQYQKFKQVGGLYTNDQST